MSESQTTKEPKNVSTFEQPTEKLSTGELFAKEYSRFSAYFLNGKRDATFAHIVASPVHYEPGYKYPLIVWLHDSEKTETEILETAPKISARNYVAVAPRGVEFFNKNLVRSSVNGSPYQETAWAEPSFSWLDDENSVALAEHLVLESIAVASSKYNINFRKIFIVGRGVGGTMALRVAMRNPQEFAGVVCIDGALPKDEPIPLRNWSSLRDLPVLLTSGRPNSTVTPQLDKDALRLYHAAGLTVLVRQYYEENTTKEVLNARSRAILADVNRWLMEREPNKNRPSSELFSNLY